LRFSWFFGFLVSKFFWIFRTAESGLELYPPPFLLCPESVLLNKQMVCQFLLDLKFFAEIKKAPQNIRPNPMIYRLISKSNRQPEFFPIPFCSSLLSLFGHYLVDF